MALARIISHSHEHCRELAVDLLARGYAVEIVSPDKIPDNFADLELRVDTDAAHDLTAKVAARTGQHSSFLDFVHHLNAPMGDFARRPAKPKFESIANLTPVSFNAEPSIAEVEVPARNQNSEPALVPLVEIPNFEIPKLTFSPKRELTPPQIPIVPLPVSVPQIAEDRLSAASDTEEVPARPIRPRPKRGMTIILHRPRPEPKTKSRNSKQAGGSWFLQVAAGFALIVALSAIPIVGIRGVDPLVPKASADAQKIVPAEPAPQESSSSRTTIPETPKAPAEIHDQGRKLTASSSSVKKPLRQAAVAKSQAKTKELTSDAPLIYGVKPVAKAQSHAGHEKARHHPDDSIAQDTITYIDRGPSPRNH